MKRLYCLAATLTLMNASGTHAQDYLPVAFDWYPRETITDARAGSRLEGMKVGLTKFAVGLGVPFDLGATQVSLGARYEGLNVDLVNSEGLQLIPPDDLHYARLEIRLKRGLNPQWSIAIVAAPGIASDFDEVGADDWRLLGNVMVAREVTARLRYGFGVGYTSDFGTPLVLPLVKLNWHSEGRLKFDALLPVYAYIAVDISPLMEFGLVGRVSGTQYNINVDRSEYGLPGAPESFDQPAKYSIIAVGPTFKRHLSGPLYLLAEAGWTAKRRFEFDGDIIDTSLDQNQSAYLRAGLVIRSNAQ